MLKRLLKHSQFLEPAHSEDNRTKKKKNPRQMLSAQMCTQRKIYEACLSAMMG